MNEAAGHQLDRTERAAVISKICSGVSGRPVSFSMCVGSADMALGSGHCALSIAIARGNRMLFSR
jgi:hypothetical protein